MIRGDMLLAFFKTLSHKLYSSNRFLSNKKGLTICVWLIVGVVIFRVSKGYQYLRHKGSSEHPGDSAAARPRAAFIASLIVAAFRSNDPSRMAHITD